MSPLSPELEQLVLDNLDLPGIHATKLARRHGWWRYDDFVADGNVGLVRAARTYRPNGGASFRTYAAQCVWGAIMRGERDFSKRRRVQQARTVSLDLSLGDGVTVGDGLEAPIEYEPEGRAIDRVALVDAFSYLSEDETIVMEMLATGASQTAIAEHLEIAISQVRTIIRRARRRLALALGQPGLLQTPANETAQAV